MNMSSCSEDVEVRIDSSTPTDSDTMHLPAINTGRFPMGNSVVKDDFIPYDAPASFVPSINFAIGHTRLRLEEVERIRKLAFNSRPEEEARARLMKEKESLHKKSMDSVKNWGNTVMGQRKRRLAAQQERLNKLEEERQKVDREWAEVKAEERRLAVERARKMQHDEGHSVKALHAALLLSNVLQERDRQIQYRQKQAELVAAIAKQEDSRVHAAEAEEEKKEMESVQKARVERWKVAECQREQMKLREEAEMRRRKMDDEYQIMRNKQAEQEALARKETERERRHRQSEELKDFILLDRKRKEAEKKVKEEAERQEKEENEKFMQMKQVLAKKRKEVDLSRVRVRVDRVEAAAREAQNSDREKIERIDEFVEKGIIAHAGDAARREAEDRRRRKKMVEDIEKFRIENMEVIQKRAEQEKQEDKVLRDRLEEQAADYHRQMREEKEEKARKLDALKKAHREQIAENSRRRSTLDSAILASQIASLSTLATDQAEFEEYAMSLVKEWADAGKDVRPILRVLRMSKENKVAGVGATPVDTFERLGFTVRWF
ncbi:hypothetical protein HK104_003085 [Borealophlyctis nickersoniae]|nr:hypothetical protein HK104_003085 [Borealophlyctis nickersoniae]